MTTTTSTSTTLSVTCRTADLLTAIAAVAPHTGKQREGGGVERVRLVVDTTVMRLALLATSGQAAAVALVPLEDADEPTTPDGEAVTSVEADLTADALKVLSTVHRRKASESTGQERVRLDLPDAAYGYAPTVQATDTTGLLPGRSVRVLTCQEWDTSQGERVDAARVVLSARADDLAAPGAVALSADSLARWAQTARALGALPAMATTGARVVVPVGGSTEDLAGLVFLGADTALAVPDGTAGEPAWDGPAVAALMGLLLDGVPHGGEPARDAEHQLVTDITRYLASQAPTDGDGSDGGAPEGGDAA